MKLNRLIILFLTVLLFHGCKKEEKGLVPPNDPRSKEIGLSGTIYGPNGYPVEGAVVIIDGHKSITSASGLFEYTGTVSNVDKVKLSISKNGYFKYSKIFTLEENSSIEKLAYYLTQEESAGSFESISGGTVTTSYVTLVFQPNSFVNEDGSTYNGKVMVKMPFGAITSDYENKLPGDSRALTAANEKVVVESWGGINVQVYNNAGQPLKLVKPVNYTYKREQYDSNTPNEKFKIWAYNEIEDIWKEAGDAQASQQDYKGSATSLSYLRWGVAYPRAFLRANVTDGMMTPASFFRFGCGVNGAKRSLSWVRINSKGFALTYVAANMELITSVSSPCYDFLNSFRVTAIATGTTVNQNIVVNLTPYQTHVSGKIEDCSFKGVKGRAEFTFDGKKMVTSLNNGYFSFAFLYCQISYSRGQMIVYDEQNKIVYKDDDYLVTAGRTTDHIATVCTKPQTGKISVNVEGKTYTFQTPQDKVSMINTIDLLTGGPLVMVLAENADKTQSFSLSYLGSAGGDVSLYTCGLSMPGSNYLMSWGLYERGTAQITKYKTDNTMIEGAFKTKANLNFSGYGDAEVELSGSFSVLR